MGTLLSKFCAAALASAVALAGVAPLEAGPMIRSAGPATVSHVVPVVDSKIVRRHKPDHDGKVWKKRRHRRDHHDGARADRRHHGDFKHKRGRRDDGDWLYRPKATPKYAYDAFGNLRVYEDDGWDRDRKWDGRGHRIRKHRPRIIRNDFDSTVPSPELLEILTAVPKVE